MDSAFLMEVDQFSRLLGELSGKVDSLSRQLDNNEKNARGRWSNVYNRFDEQDKVLTGIVTAARDTNEEVRYLKDTITKDVKPVTDEVRQWKLMGMGALAVTGVGAASIGAALLWVWQNLTHIKLP